MSSITQRSGGVELLLQGNEAIARGALEGGVIFCAAYPGNPSSEILETLAEASKDLSIYVEWSVNEKVALEAATAASFAGCRALVSMKQNGVNVASDFLTNLTLSGTKGGLVLISCDDPSGISSTNEEDARLFAKLSDIPLLEPATPQEALEMTKWAFELSEKIKNIVMIRSVSRLSHTRANVLIGDLPHYKVKPHFDSNSPFHTFPVMVKHKLRHQKLEQVREIFENSPFNHYEGPFHPDLLVIASGCAWTYIGEAVSMLGLSDKVGALKLGTTWPLPEDFLKRHISLCDRILFVEDVDPFLEDSIKSMVAGMGHELGVKDFMGKSSGHLPDCGEQSHGTIMRVLGNLFNVDWENSGFKEEAAKLVEGMVPIREFGFCPGCPHRGAYYAIKTALTWDDRDGFVSGDIGCYTMGIWPTGFSQVKSVHAMGSGVGLASGYGKLTQFGFDQPVVTVCGDSTFFHAAIPALINAKFNQSDILLLILDNSATAMTGFQPHPGTGSTAMGITTEPVDVEGLCQALQIHVEVGDPYDMKGTARALYRLIQKPGPRVLILRRKCALVQGREEGFPYQMDVNQEHCLGEECGCGRYCTRIFRCPGLIWDNEVLKARIDEVICVGCGICAEICPQGAIERNAK
ncbi:MAG: indolepyruvate ferredoxin oxidoreductase subunit alpha [Pseudomonadota bacterium]